MNREKEAPGLSGYGALLFFVALLLLCLFAIFRRIIQLAALETSGVEVSVGTALWPLLGYFFGIALAVLCLKGLFIVNPNESKVLQLFGSYQGTAKVAGLRWANPLYSKRKVSVRTRNFETNKLKVNDKAGNPIEIAAVVVWRVVDTAEAMFNVDDYVNFVSVQSESALRNLATHFGYVADHEGEMALSSHTSDISVKLRAEIQDRLTQAGVEVQEARISHLAYSAEIAAAMLQRQQASAVIAARAMIVEGAVGMVEHALQLLAQKGVVELDSERRAAMVSNLLVVLCSDRHTQPVVNTGTLYS